jgi:hypothetical protein
MEQGKFNKLSIIKFVIENSSVLPFYQVPCTFFEYYLQKKQLEIFQQSIKHKFTLQICGIKNKTKKNHFRWVQRIALSIGIILSAYFFVGIPRALACTILTNKISIKTIWNVLAKEKETKKQEQSSYVSKKILLAGGLILVLSIGAILFHEVGISRVLFTPKLEEIPLYKFNPVSYTLEENELLDKINFDTNLNLRKEMLKLIIRNFGSINFQDLLEGRVSINYVNNEAIFTFLANLLTQAGKLSRYENYLNGFERIETYINPLRLKEARRLRKILLDNLNQIISSNPEQLMKFKTIMTTVLTKVEKGQAFNFSLDFQKAVINEMLTHYFRQRMLTPLQ